MVNLEDGPSRLPQRGGSKRAPQLGRLRVAAASVVALLASISAVRAEVTPYNITPEEHAACDSDAERLCSAAYPDPDKLIACMKANRGLLGETCRSTFEHGMQKRHLSL